MRERKQMQRAKNRLSILFCLKKKNISRARKTL